LQRRTPQRRIFADTGAEEADLVCTFLDPSERQLDDAAITVASVVLPLRAVHACNILCAVLLVGDMQADPVARRRLAREASPAHTDVCRTCRRQHNQCVVVRHFDRRALATEHVSTVGAEVAELVHPWFARRCKCQRLSGASVLVRQEPFAATPVSKASKKKKERAGRRGKAPKRTSYYYVCQRDRGQSNRGQREWTALPRAALRPM